MANDDTDDVFRDFEERVTDKKPSPYSAKREADESPEKGVDEEQLLKRRYQKAEQALKEKYNKEMEALEGKRRKGMSGSGKVPAKNPSNIKKIAYISIILVLVAYIAIDLSFYHGGKSVEPESDEITTGAVKVGEETEGVEEKVAEEEMAEEEKEEVVEEEPAKEEENETKEAVEEEKKLSGLILMVIDDVDTEVTEGVNDSGKINKVVFTIDNGKNKVLTPLVDVYAYDGKMDKIWETKSRGQYTYEMGIKPGGQHTGSIDLVPKTFKNLNLEKNIRLTLNDTEGGYITAANKVVIIS